MVDVSNGEVALHVLLVGNSVDPVSDVEDQDVAIRIARLKN